MKKLLLILLTTCLVFACQKHEIDLKHQDADLKTFSFKSNPNIIEGVMCFDTNDEFSSYIGNVLKLNDSDLDIFENYQKFESLRMRCNELMDEVTNSKSIEDINTFAKIHEKYIRIDYKAGEAFLTENVSSRLFRSVANIDGVFITGIMANRVLKDFLITCELSKLSELIEIEETQVGFLNSDVFRVQNLKQQSHLLKTGCGTYDYDEALDSGNDYKVKVEIELDSYVLYYQPYPYSTCIDVTVTTTNYNKFLGVWFKNKANLSHSGSCEAGYYFDGQTSTASQTIWTTAGYEKQIVSIDRIITLDGYDQNFYCYFTKYDADAYSDEVDRDPATVLCGY